MCGRRIGVRPAAASDVPAILALLRELGYASVTADTVRAVLADAGCLPLVAEADGSTAGFLNASFRTQLHHGGVVGRIDELVVAATHRGQGIGRSLLQAALSAARERRARLVEVTCRLSRHDSHRFYEAAGFRRTSYRFEIDVPAA